MVVHISGVDASCYTVCANGLGGGNFGSNNVCFELHFNDFPINGTFCLTRNPGTCAYEFDLPVTVTVSLAGIPACAGSGSGGGTVVGTFTAAKIFVDFYIDPSGDAYIADAYVLLGPNFTMTVPFFAFVIAPLVFRLGESYAMPCGGDVTIPNAFVSLCIATESLLPAPGGMMDVMDVDCPG